MRKHWRPYGLVATLLAVLGMGFALPTAGVAGGGTLKISPMVFSVGDVVVGAPCQNTVVTGIVCTLTISAPASAGKPLGWNALDESDAGASGGGTATFSPSYGYVNPGQSVKVKVTPVCEGIVAWFFFGDVPHGATAVIFGCG